MSPFDAYPAGGRTLLGRLTRGNETSRNGYGLDLQRRTGTTTCAYCRVSLVDDYYRWLLRTVDHVVPQKAAEALGIDKRFWDDTINIVLCCPACNRFTNSYKPPHEPQDAQSFWTLEAFLTLRDRAFADKLAIVTKAHQRELAAFAARSWAPF